MDRLLKFALVGGSGTLINLSLFVLLVDRGGVNPTVGAVLCFAIAVTSNYLLDHLWTFRTQIAGERPSLSRYVRFVGASLLGLAVNLGTLNLAIYLFHPVAVVLAQAAGIAGGTAVNFIGSNLIAFRAKRQVKEHP